MIGLEGVRDKTWATGSAHLLSYITKSPVSTFQTVTGHLQLFGDIRIHPFNRAGLYIEY